VNYSDTVIPKGDFCYRVVPIAEGEILSTDFERFGRDLREYPFNAHGDKRVLCPYWIRTTHGTVRCERLDLEVFDDDLGYYDHETALEKATQHFGKDNVASKVGRSWELPDELKVCGINLDEDEDSPP
jgi:hypothetical protein